MTRIKYIFIILTLFIATSYSQRIYAYQNPATTLLSKTLIELGKKFKVNFMYDDELLSNKLIRFDLKTNSDAKLESILTDILKPEGLLYYHVDNNNYVIYKHTTTTTTAQKKPNPTASADTLKSSTITGLIYDQNNNPLEYCTVSLLRAGDSVSVKTVLSDSVGRYVFKNMEAGNYLIKAGQLGYNKYQSQVFQLTANGSFSAPTIVLNAQINQLNEVKVSARKPLFEHRNDKTIVNVESSALAAGGSVNDVLEIAPGVSIDNNQITLKGKQGVTVMIDDKVVNLSASQVSSLLQSMPANSIDKIELISNPSAKYDAEGKGGVINIKTKKGSNLGFNGTITSGLAVGVYPKLNEGLNLNYKFKKLNLFSNYSYQHNKNINEYLSDKIITGQTPLTYHQDQISHSNSDAHNARLGADYELNDKNTIGILGTLNTNTRKSDFIQEVNFKNYGTQQRDSSLSSINQGAGNFHTYGLNLNSRHVLGADDHLLFFNADYTTYRSSNPNTYLNSYFDASGKPSRNSESVLNNAAVAIDLFTAKADYSYPINKTSKFEAGAKTAITHSNSDILFQSSDLAGQFITDINRSNTFDYRENITAVYLNYSGKLGEKTDLQFGLRGENTHYSGKSITTGQTVGRNYLQLFPSAFLLHSFGENTMGISYSRRIGRPSYEDLNPFIEYASPYFYTQGNPLLKPETTNSLELNYSYHNDLNVSLGYSRTNDYYNYFTSLADSNGATRQTVDNFKHYDTWNLSLSYNKEVMKHWNLTLNGDVFYDRFQTPYLGAFIDVERVGYNANLLNTFQLNDVLSFELLNIYRSKRVVLARTIDGKYRADAAFKYNVLKNKGSIKLGVTDIFYTYINKGLNQFEGLYGTFYNRNENRRFNLSLSYKIGGKATAPKKTQSNKEELERIK